MSTTTLNGSDPTIFLTNGTRIVLGLEGESTRTQSVVQAAQDAYFAEYGVWPYVEGMPNKAGSPPTPPATTIGNVTASGVGLTGDSVALNVGNTTDITAAFDGDATDVSFKWTIRSGVAVSIVGDSTNRTVKLQGDEVGMATIRCTLTSAKSSDSPAELTLSAVVEA